MNKVRLALAFVLAVALSAVTIPSARAKTKTLDIGGTMSLTGPFAEDSAAVLAGFEDYAKYVNDNHKISPWGKLAFPSDIKLKVMWRDDGLKPARALTIYQELKADGMLVGRISGSPIALALKDRMWEDHMGATSMATGPYLLTPPQSIFTYYPIYSDALAAIADWFKANWKEKREPRVAFLTADNAMGRSVVIPKLIAYLKKDGYKFVGTQYVPLVPVSPPTTQLEWLKKKGVDLALGVMINPGAQPTVKEMDRLGMGPDKPYKMTFGTATPGHAAILAEAMGKAGDGYVCAGSFPPLTDMSIPGIRFCNELQQKYRPNHRVGHIMYEAGVIEAMIQTDALRLAMQKTPVNKLTRRDVLVNGFYRIKDLKTGGMSSTPITYGKGHIEGVNKITVDQVRNGKAVQVGLYPVHNIY